MVRPENRLAFFQRRVKQRIGLIELAHRLVNVGESQIEIRLHARVAVQTLRLFHAAIEQSHNAQAIGWPHLFIPAFQQIGHELFNALRSSSFHQSGVALLGQSQSEKNNQTGDEEEDQRCRENGARRFRLTNLPAR